VKRLLIKLELLVAGRAYCATVEREPGEVREHLDHLGEVCYPSWSRRAAERKAARREAATGTRWVVTRWART